MNQDIARNLFSKVFIKSNIVRRLKTPNFLLIKEDRLYGRTTGVHPIVRKDFFGLSYYKSKLMSQKDSNGALNRRMLNIRKLQGNSLYARMHMHKFSFKLNYKHSNSIRKTTSSMKNRTTHRR